MDEDNWVKVTTYEEAFRRIQEATGVSNIEVSSFQLLLKSLASDSQEFTIT